MDIKGVHQEGIARLTQGANVMTIEQKIEAAIQIILNSKPGSPEAIRAGYDVVTLRNIQTNPSAYIKGA